MPSGFLLNYLLALAVVGLMLFGLYTVVRGLSRGRLLGRSHGRLVDVIASTYVAQHTTVHVIRAGERYLVVGGGAGQLRTLGELTAAEVEDWLARQRAQHGAQMSSLAEVWSALRGRRS